MIKAVAGGGGRGMRVAHNEPSQRLSTPRVMKRRKHLETPAYLEKLIDNPHHIEFQIMADNNGHIIHLGERDCSIQRRNQKVVEESPSPVMTPSFERKWEMLR